MYRHPPIRLRAVLPLLLAAVVAACDDDDPTAPTTAQVTGSYEATTLIARAPGGDIDYLASGSSLSLALHLDGTTSGSFFVPGGDDGGGDLDVDLAGTWTLEGTQVHLDHEADTFLRDVVWTYASGRLAADTSELEVVLTRQ